MYNFAVKFDATPDTPRPDRETLLAVLLVRVMRRKSLENLRIHNQYASQVDAYLEKKRYIQRVANFTEAGKLVGNGSKFDYSPTTQHSRQGWARQQRSQRERVRLFEEGVRLGLESIFAREHRLDLPIKQWGRRLMDRREILNLQQELAKMPIEEPPTERRTSKSGSIRRPSAVPTPPTVTVRRMSPLPAPLLNIGTGNVDSTDPGPQQSSSTKRKARKSKRGRSMDILDDSILHSTKHTPRHTPRKSPLKSPKSPKVRLDILDDSILHSTKHTPRKSPLKSPKSPEVRMDVGG